MSGTSMQRELCSIKGLRKNKFPVVGELFCFLKVLYQLSIAGLRFIDKVLLEGKRIGQYWEVIFAQTLNNS